MQYATWLALGAVAILFSTFYLVLEEGIAASTLVAAGAWSLLAIRAQQLTRYHQDGTTTTVGEPAVQLFALGMAVLSLGTFVLWWAGQYPIGGMDDPEGEDTLHPDGRARNP